MPFRAFVFTGESEAAEEAAEEKKAEQENQVAMKAELAEETPGPYLRLTEGCIKPITTQTECNKAMRHFGLGANVAQLDNGAAPCDTVACPCLES